MPEPLEVVREGLALFRRAGLFWAQTYNPALDAALHVAPSKHERDEWLEAIAATRTAWMRAYDRRDTGSELTRADAGLTVSATPDI